MIHLNQGLTSEELAKVEKPYAGNCREVSFSYQDAGLGIAEFIRDNKELLLATGRLLDQAREAE